MRCIIGWTLHSLGDHDRTRGKLEPSMAKQVGMGSEDETFFRLRQLERARRISKVAGDVERAARHAQPALVLVEVDAGGVEPVVEELRLFAPEPKQGLVPTQ